jgi:AcrR family transcriptional regulator
MRISDTDILLVAKGLFSDKGYASVSTREIASMAGISEMTLFRKFHTKRELLDRILEDNQPAFSEIDPAAFQSKKDCFKAFMKMLFSVYRAHNDVSRIIMTSPEIMDKTMIRFAREGLDSFQGEIRRFLERLFKSGGGQDPGYTDENYDILAFYICAQVMGFFLLNTVLNVSPPKAWSWEKLEEGFAERVGDYIFKFSDC